MKEEVAEGLKEESTLTLISVSDPAEKKEYRSIRIRPVTIKGKEMFQAECFTQKQAFHKNIAANGLREWFEENCDGYKQYVFMHEDKTVTVLCSQKGSVRVRSRNVLNKAADRENDRKKSYILGKDMPVSILADLGVCDAEGKIIKDMNKKFRQIDRFISIIDDNLKDFEGEEITVLDFGCGKSYLTFLCYHYLTRILGKKAVVIGYDINEKTVELCRSLAEKYDCSGISFYAGDVTKHNMFNGTPDLLMSLHACDTATDATLLYAATHGVKRVLSVPCCQHEINSIIGKGGDFDLLTGAGGVIKDRFCALLTDSVREELMKRCGYAVDVFEFVEFAHSPKNLMLRCVKKRDSFPETEDIESLLDKYNVKQSLLEGIKKHYGNKPRYQKSDI